MYSDDIHLRMGTVLRHNLMCRILYVIPRFAYRLMKEGKPEPESTEDVSKQMTAVIVGFEMYNFDKPAFVIPLQNANFRQIQETPEAFEEGPTEGLLVISSLIKLLAKLSYSITIFLHSVRKLNFAMAACNLNFVT